MDQNIDTSEVETSSAVAKSRNICPNFNRLTYVKMAEKSLDSTEPMDSGCVGDTEIGRESSDSSESTNSDDEDDLDDDPSGTMCDFLDPDEQIFAETLTDDSQLSYPSYDVECKFVEVDPKLGLNKDELGDETDNEEYFEDKSNAQAEDECQDQDNDNHYSDINDDSIIPNGNSVTEKSLPVPMSCGRKKKYYKSRKVYVCPMCDHVFYSHSNRRAHMRVHTNERPFTCAHCNRTFVQKSALKRHIRIHTGEKPFSCPICQREFSRKSCMKMHEKAHSDEKPYSCSLCDYACKYPAALRKHIRIHTGEKPYSCSFCLNTFTSKIGMIEHERIHTGEQPYSCTLCPYRTSRYASLRRHKGSHGRRKFTREEIETMIIDLDKD